MTILQKIRKKVRRLTATPSVLQLPDSEIDEYIDTFYEQDMPAALKLWNLRDVHTFYTEANVDRYTLPVNSILSVLPPVYIAGRQATYFNSRDQLYRVYPKNEYQEQVATGDGTSTYSFTTNNSPILQHSFYVSAIDTNSLQRTLVDVPVNRETGTLYTFNPSTQTTDTSVARGTIDYLTGVVTNANFPDTIDNSIAINASYNFYEPSLPTAMLFYDDEFILRPIPDKAYKVDVESYVKPSMLLNQDADSPDLEQWWQYIAFGASLKVLEDRQDTETMKNIYPGFEDQEEKVLNRTIVQQTPLRTATIYSESSTNEYGNPYRSGY